MSYSLTTCINQINTNGFLEVFLNYIGLHCFYLLSADLQIYEIG